MKRLISLALCLVLITSLAACGSNKMRSEYILNFDTGNSYAFTSKYPDFHEFRGDIKLTKISIGLLIVAALLTFISFSLINNTVRHGIRRVYNSLTQRLITLT